MKITVLIMAILMLPLTASAGDFPAKEVYTKYSPSVVVVRAVQEGGGGSMGTGSIFTNDGLVITNAHVIINKEEEKPYAKIGVFLKPPKGTSTDKLDRYYDVQVLKYDIPLDLAVLKIKGFDAKVNTIEFADPKEIEIGEDVIAIGHPESGGFWTLTYGRISAESHNFQKVPGKDMYQTDTSVNRGNSGGPLLDRRGYMVAVNSNIARQSEDGLAITGINYSIKSSVVRKWLDENGYKVAYGTRPLEEKQVASVKPQEEKESKPEAKPQEPEKKVAKAEPQPEAPKEKADAKPVTEAPSKEEKKASAAPEEKKVAQPEQPKAKENTDIKPKPAEEKKVASAEPKKTEEKKAEEKKPEKRFETPKKPYDYDDFLKKAEKELDEMMDDMRGKLRR